MDVIYIGLKVLQLVSNIQQAKQLCRQWQTEGKSIAFVPTMGCLHEGHLSLVNEAKSQSDIVIVSIFVNPLQFDNADDLLKYPSTLDDDVSKLADFNVDLILTPKATELYPEGENAVEKIELGGVTELLEGAKRPGHFDGVATVINRLFELIRPNIAIFGEKDFQQLIVIKQLVKKLDLDIKIIGMPTFREQNGLAMSSRNNRLSESERNKAGEIYRQLESIKSAINNGETDYSTLEKNAYDNLLNSGFTPDYVVVREVATLLPPDTHLVDMVILIATKLGDIRLIDNLRV